MAFDVDFYTFAKEVNSTAQPPSNTKVTKSCKANGRIDIINPSISLQLGLGGTDSPVAYNYCYIQIFGRYYFIENWEWEGGLWTAHCAVDVLATYKTNINNMTAYVVRSAHSFDETISDALYQGKEEFTIVRNTGDTPWITSIWNGTVVVGITGDNVTNYFKFQYNNFLAFIQSLLSNAYVSDVVGTWQLDAYSEAKSIVDPLQYITSVMYIPLQDWDNMGNTVVRVGFGNVTAYCKSLSLGSGAVTSHDVYLANIPTHPLASTRGKYLNYAPWTTHTLDVAPFGIIEIDPSMMNGRIRVNYKVDWITGAVIARVIGQTYSNNAWNDMAEMNVLKGQIGTTIQIGQVVAKTMGTLTNIQHGANLVSQIMGGITGGGGTGGMIGNQLGLGGGIINTIGSVIGGLASGVSGGAGWIRDSIESSIPHLNTVGSTGSYVENISVLTLNTKFIHPMNENREQRGRPLCATHRLGDLAADVPESGTNIYHSGYMLLADPDVNFTGTATEKAMVVQFMVGGFYLA